MVWAAIVAVWVLAALWLLAEHMVATGTAYRAVAGYARRRAAAHPELADDVIVTHDAVLQLLDPAVAALFTPGELVEHGDRGRTARWYVRDDGQLFPTVTRRGDTNVWPDGTTTTGPSPSWVFGPTPAAGLLQLYAHRQHTPRRTNTRPAIPIPTMAASRATPMEYGWITRERVR